MNKIFRTINLQNHTEQRARRRFFCLAVILLFFGASCASKITMELKPDPLNKAENNLSPHFGSLNIKKIAVLDFQSSSQDRREKFVPPPQFNLPAYDRYVYLSENDGAFVSDLVERKLISNFKYKLLDRRQLAETLKEQKLQLSGLIEESETVKIGQLLGCDAILTGKVTNAYALLEIKTGSDGSFMGTYLAFGGIEMRLIHIETGQIVWQYLVNRNTLNYLDKTIKVSNLQFVKDPHILDQNLHGGIPEERIKFVLEQIITEAFVASI